ncbi:hypothetical protein NDU88_000058 [Pleurodeles waltl]|uniref:Uncharacterized protein n=1 Tax=Pleurodeles waltl TaxID=8319 RepID=A0AAV7KNN2_PLEWA|nr:hypothetical protein NDU88_000058 [Pleurodeles waltl]
MRSLVQPVPWRVENVIGRVGGVPRRHQEECPGLRLGLPAGRPSSTSGPLPFPPLRGPPARISHARTRLRVQA